MNCNDNPPAASVGADIEKARTRLFKDSGRKKDVLITEMGYPQSETITYQPHAFYNLLKILVDPSKYDGIRVYFAAYATSDPGTNLFTYDQQMQLTLIFVPTKAGVDPKIHVDDTTNCWIIKQTDPYQLPDPQVNDKQHDVASNWVNYYLQNSMPFLITDGQDFTGNESFSETRSLWYDTMLLQRRPGDRKGLLDYIECLLRQTDPTKPDYFDKIIVEFSAFLSREAEPKKYPYYQLSLIFNFHQVGDALHGGKGKNNYFSFSVTDFSEEDKHLFTKHKLGGGSDTGLPCPPSTTCQGASLPHN